jgi:hypothetical protein
MRMLLCLLPPAPRPVSSHNALGQFRKLATIEFHSLWAAILRPLGLLFPVALLWAVGMFPIFFSMPRSLGVFSSRVYHLGLPREIISHFSYLLDYPMNFVQYEYSASHGLINTTRINTSLHRKARAHFGSVRVRRSPIAPPASFR